MRLKSVLLILDSMKKGSSAPTDAFVFPSAYINSSNRSLIIQFHIPSPTVTILISLCFKFVMLWLYIVLITPYSIPALLLILRCPSSLAVLL